MRQMLIVLTVVMVLSGLVLAGTFTSLDPRIEANRIAALNASLAAIFQSDSGADTGGDGLTFDEITDPAAADAPTIYRGRTADGELLGYAVRLQTQGYGGMITMLVGLDPELTTIEGIEIVEQIETPGLGGNITTDAFKEQFAELSAAEQITLVKNVEPSKAENEVQALSGATITSLAVVGGVNETLDRAIEIIERQAQ